MPEQDSKQAKKEVEEDEDEMSLASTFANRKKKLLNNSNATAKLKNEQNKVKKVEDDEDFEENKPSKKTDAKV